MEQSKDVLVASQSFQTWPSERCSGFHAEEGDGGGSVGTEELFSSCGSSAFKRGRLVGLESDLVRQVARGGAAKRKE